jgi:UDP-GlcNAc:undecaprenyl-phosphate GlcNAc-1-phosphate transferase
VFPEEAGSWFRILEKLWSPGIWVFLGALMLSLLGTPVFRWWAMRKGVWDQPDDAVKIHSARIPYLGGCAIWLAWTVSVLVFYLVQHEVEWGAVAAVLGGGVVAFLTGLIDDLKDIRPRAKLLGQALAGAVLLLGGIVWFAYPHYAGLPILGLGQDSRIVLVICLGVHFLVVIGATNATNLLDGLDGLCSGVAAIISVGFLLLATSLTAWGNPEWVARPVTYEYTRLAMIVAFALAGAAIGFLPYNFNPARIFMGDAGSVFIGYVLAAMMIMFASKFGMVKWFIGALFIFGLPIFDTGVAVVRRVLNRRPIMMPDRSHLYNQLVDRLGLSVRTTVWSLYVVSALMAAAGLMVLYLKGRQAAVVYVALGAVFLVVVWRLGFLRMTADEKEAADRYLARKRGRAGGG